VSARRFAEELRGNVLRGYRRLLAHVAPDLTAKLKAARLHLPLHGFAGQPGFLRRPWGAGWALVGDAAYFKDPITAHGISDALRDAELLARAIVQGRDAALADYEHTRDALSTRLFEVTDRVAFAATPIFEAVDLAAVRAREVATGEAGQRPADDVVGSTEMIIRTLREAPSGSGWAVGTEFNLVNRLARQMTDKKIVILSKDFCICATMYRISPQNLAWALDSIVEGRPNGMPGYGGRLTVQQVWQLVSYVQSMSGQLRKDVRPGRSDNLYLGQSEQARRAQPSPRLEPARAPAPR